MQKNYRNEQMLLYSILKSKLEGCKIRLEYEVWLKPSSETKTTFCIPDIVILYDQGKKIAIRMMGEKHTSSCIISRKDKSQKQALEHNGWKVIDIEKEYYPRLWDNIIDNIEINKILDLM